MWWMSPLQTDPKADHLFDAATSTQDVYCDNGKKSASEPQSNSADSEFDRMQQIKVHEENSRQIIINACKPCFFASHKGDFS